MLHRRAQINIPTISAVTQFQKEPMKHLSAQWKNKMSTDEIIDVQRICLPFFLLSFRCTNPWGCDSWTAFLHTDHSTFIHLFIFIAILMVSIRWLLTFALTAVILLPHAAPAFCLVITYFNHSRPSHLSYILLAAPSCGAWSLQLHGFSNLGLCTLLSHSFWLLLLARWLNVCFRW